MIKFFRHIRQSFIMENKTSKYFTYAIGEIVLVVIGILIALQINNWNENRLEKIQEQSILSNLNREFVQNKQALNASITTNEEAFKAGLALMQLMEKDQAKIANVNRDSLLYKTVEFSNYTPSENAISDLLQSGRLQLLQNETLKDLLYEWSRIMAEAIEHYEGFDSKVEDELIPFLSKHYSMKDIDMYGELNWDSKSILKIDKQHIFENIEFENLIDDALYRLKRYNNSLKKAMVVIDNILKQTRAE